MIVKPVLEAYNMGVKEHGEEFMRARFEQSAVRLLEKCFHVPDCLKTRTLMWKTLKAIVGNAEFMKAGYEAQLKSVVMLKNKAQCASSSETEKDGLHVPKKFTPAGRNFLGMETPEKLESPVSVEIIKKYFQVTDNPAEADVRDGLCSIALLPVLVIQQRRCQER
jgi:beta-glucosidase